MKKMLIMFLCNCIILAALVVCAIKFFSAELIVDKIHYGIQFIAIEIFFYCDDFFKK